MSMQDLIRWLSTSVNPDYSVSLPGLKNRSENDRENRFCGLLKADNVLLAFVGRKRRNMDRPDVFGPISLNPTGYQRSPISFPNCRSSPSRRSVS
jgi:hypothetical protein